MKPLNLFKSSRFALWHSWWRGWIAGIWGCLMLAAAPVYGQLRPVEMADTIVQTYPAAQTDILEIRNKYGNVHINTWDKPDIRVQIEIISRANQYDKAGLRMKEVEIRERRFGQKIQLETNFTGNSFLRLGRELTERGVNVNYEVHLPPSIALVIDNRFGNVYIDDRLGNVDLKLNYGKLVAGRLGGTNNVFDLSLGGADIAYLGGGDVKVAFSPLTIEQAGNLSLTASSAQVRIDRTDRLRLSASLGKLELGEVGEISGEVSSASFTMQRLGEKMDLVVRYATSFDVMQVAKGFESITLDGRFTSFRLGFAPEAAFDLDAEIQFGKMTTFAIGDPLSEAIMADKITAYTGRIGATRAGTGSSTLTVRSKYGNLKLTK